MKDVLGFICILLSISATPSGETIPPAAGDSTNPQAQVAVQQFMAGPSVFIENAATICEKQEEMLAR